MSLSVSPRLLLDGVTVGDSSRARLRRERHHGRLGALATRDWRPMHHDKDFAVYRNGTQDIFLKIPNQAAWFERYLTDWTGPQGRLGRVTFRMKGSVFPGTPCPTGGGRVDGGGRGGLRLRQRGRHLVGGR